MKVSGHAVPGATEKLLFSLLPGKLPPALSGPRLDASVPFSSLLSPHCKLKLLPRCSLSRQGFWRALTEDGWLGTHTPYGACPHPHRIPLTPLTPPGLSGL